MSARWPRSGKPDIAADMAPRRLLTDAVEKVGDGEPARNNRIASDDFLNRTCAFGRRLESILFRGPPQNPFSTASTQSGHRPRGISAMQNGA
jgi:hypothetical protein